MSGGGSENGRQTIGIGLHADSGEIHVGLELQNSEIMTSAQVQGSTDWASRMPLTVFIFLQWNTMSYFYLLQHFENHVLFLCPLVINFFKNVPSLFFLITRVKNTHFRPFHLWHVISYTLKMFSQKSLHTDIYYLFRLGYVPQGSQSADYLSDGGRPQDPPSWSSLWHSKDRQEEKSVCLHCRIWFQEVMGLYHCSHLIIFYFHGKYFCIE